MRVIIKDARSHRNGVAGRGFFAVEFKATLNGDRNFINALAICQDDIDDKDADRKVQVLALNEDGSPDIIHPYRGDEIGLDLIPALRKWYAKHTKQAHQH